MIRFVILSWFKSVTHHCNHLGSLKNTGSQAPPWNIVIQVWDGPQEPIFWEAPQGIQMNSRFGNLWYKLISSLKQFFSNINSREFFTKPQEILKWVIKSATQGRPSLQACGWKRISQSRNQLSYAKDWCKFPQ